ncbi:imm11 family protein [Cystobacter fuscus]|uniref:imm11 family protein n=1 Tax=Cystobacter fuscus TaxID=43 RepID=UPI002B2AC3D0|nr:hypothetical protein F0U63_42275 [Cystobacter fuscus]
MTMRYFTLLTGPASRQCWRLAEPVDAQGHKLGNPYIFTDGKPVSVEGRLKVAVTTAGKPLDFSLAGASNTPIVSERLAKLLAQGAPDDVQLLPVDVEGQSEPHSILVATRTVRCIDDPNCVEVKHWTPKDGYELVVGQYKAIQGLRIDPTKVGQPQVFRPWGWTVALIVSENIQQQLARSRFSGMDFEEVTGPKEVRTE